MPDMAQSTDQAIESLIREGWAAQGLAARDLPPSEDPRMHGLIAIVRLALRGPEAKVARLERRAEEVERQVAELERRVRQLEARVGVGQILQ
jgi:hypothetical protein